MDLPEDWRILVFAGGKMGSRSTIVFAFVLASMAPAVAGAGDEDVVLAERYFKLGSELYRRSDYAEALKLCAKSYGLSKLPALLFNMARCKESLGDHAGAITLFEQYRSTNPPEASLIETRIKNLRRLVERPQPEPVPCASPAGSASPPAAYSWRRDWCSAAWPAPPLTISNRATATKRSASLTRWTIRIVARRSNRARSAP